MKSLTPLHPGAGTLALTARAERYLAEHARPLRALAYRMLGSRTEAEDVVQDAWLRWSSAADDTDVRQTRAYLSTIVTRLCLDRLKSAAGRREHYVGLWLPEPLLGDEAHAWSPEAATERAQDVSIAFLLALDCLSPLERAAFLLHDVFDCGYDEIAAKLARSEAACRQLASRARIRLRSDYRRRELSVTARTRLSAAFCQALAAHDIEALTRLLADDAILFSDGGGKVRAIGHPLRLGPRIARALVAFARLPSSTDWCIRPAMVNGMPGCAIVDPVGSPAVQILALAPDGADPGRIGRLYVQRNPDKLGDAAARLSAISPPPAP